MLNGGVIFFSSCRSVRDLDDLLLGRSRRRQPLAEEMCIRDSTDVDVRDSTPTTTASPVTKPRIRDVFVFCCLTGLAFADADHLRREHLSQDDEGRWWICLLYTSRCV